MAPQADQQQKPSGQDEFDAFIERTERGFFRAVKKTRDELDAGISKILSLTPDDRIMLATKAEIAGMFLFAAHSVMGPANNDPKQERPTDKRAVALESISRVLRLDSRKIPPKEYEAMVKQVWKTAKATLDETLERPGVKQMLDSKGPSEK
jgi:hypothetical protein